ncbi:MAG: hypothetical protein ACOCX5_01505 [Chloroflexota bacterium]
MRLFRSSQNPNAIFGILLLLLLAIFAGPETLPRLIADVIPFADEGVPCTRLRTGEGRAYNQSLLGRDVSQQEEPPIGLAVSTSAIPASAPGTFTVTILVYNRTLGTVPVLIVPDTLITSSQPTGNGLGIVAGTTQVPPVAPNAEPDTSYPEDDIRLLGPRQRCIFRVSFDFQEIPSQFSVPGVALRAFYRNEDPGTAVANRPGLTQIFTDQGLWVGVVESAPSTIPVLP